LLRGKEIAGMFRGTGLGGGLALIGASLFSEDVYNDNFALKHTATFAGNTLACRSIAKAA
jgi:acetylornithine/succinyldiaminopimelate/putrescine aminotransferase